METLPTQLHTVSRSLTAGSHLLLTGSNKWKCVGARFDLQRENCARLVFLSSKEEENFVHTATTSRPQLSAVKLAPRADAAVRRVENVEENLTVSMQGCAWELLPHDRPLMVNNFHFYTVYQKFGIYLRTVS